MPYWPPDSAPTAPAQMPQATTPGPAPVPYTGGEQQPEPPDYTIPGVSTGLAPGAGVLNTVAGANYVTSSELAAPNVNPYEAGSPSAVMFPGDDGAVTDRVRLVRHHGVHEPADLLRVHQLDRDDDADG